LPLINYTIPTTTPAMKKNRKNPKKASSKKLDFNILPVEDSLT
jgi:hypothetical protein